MTSYNKIDILRIHQFSSQRSFMDGLIPPYKHWISSVHIADILGVGWNSPWNAWYSLRGGDLEQSCKQRMYENFKWMPIIRRLYESHVLRSVDLQFRLIEHHEESWAIASLLGYAYDPIIGEDIVVDFNLSREPNIWAQDGQVISHWNSDCGIPANIAMKAYWTMLCTGLQYTDIVVGLPSWSDILEVRVIRLLADVSLQQSLLLRVSSWRDLHLMEGASPKIDDSRACSEYLFEKYRYDNGQIRKPSNEEETLMQKYNVLTEQIRSLQNQHRQMRNELFDCIGDDRGLETEDGSKAIVTRSRGNFQIRVKIPEHQKNIDQSQPSEEGNHQVKSRSNQTFPKAS